MSTVKTVKYQVGTDGTSTNNFTIYQPDPPDGTMRIGVGNADNPTEVAQFTSSGLNASALTGTLPAIDGSALTGISSYADSDALSLFNASGSAPVYAPRAWVSWDGGATAVSTIFGSGNVSSVTDNGTGQSTINFTTALPNANYAVVGMATGYSNLCNENMVIQSANGSGDQNPTTKTTSAVRVAYGHANTAGLAHIGYLTLVVIG